MLPRSFLGHSLYSKLAIACNLNWVLSFGCFKITIISSESFYFEPSEPVDCFYYFILLWPVKLHNLTCGELNFCAVGHYYDRANNVNCICDYILWLWCECFHSGHGISKRETILCDLQCILCTMFPFQLWMCLCMGVCSSRIFLWMYVIAILLVLSQLLTTTAKKYNAISVCHLIIQSSHESCWFQRHQCEKKERSICSWRAKALWQISKIESRTAWLQKENIMKLLLIAFDYMWLQLKRKRNRKKYGWLNGKLKPHEIANCNQIRTLNIALDAFQWIVACLSEMTTKHVWSGLWIK